MIVTTTHLFTIQGYSQRRGFCRGGSRRWFVAHGLDWHRFVRQGIQSDILEATGDAMAIAVVKWARKCEEGRAQHGG